MRIIFVGIHNKPDCEPLDSKTVSGKRIDKIIDSLDLPCVKSNIYEVDYFPMFDEQKDLTQKWISKYQTTEHDIIVLLGSMVHYSFPKVPGRIIKVVHPSLQFSKITAQQYIQETIGKIKQNLGNF